MAKTDNNRAKKRTFPGLGRAAHGLGTIALIVSTLSLGQTAWAAPTITRTSGSSFFVDVDANPLLRGNYVAYQIKNDGTARSNVWVKLDMPVYSATGTITLAQYEDGLLQLGAMAPNETKTAFFYVYSGESLGQGQSKTVSAAHDVIVYEGNPNIASTQITSQNFTITKIEETIEAQANKISTIVSGPKPPELGGVVTIEITSADTGTVGNNDTIFVSPASFADWPANKFELFETSVILTPSKGAPTTLKDTLSFTYSDTASYTTIFKLRAVGTTQSPTQVSPAMQINSGSQVKHTDTSKYTSNTTNFQPIQSVDSKLQLQKLVNQSQMAAGATVTYTLRLTNSGLQTVIVQDFVDTLPTSPAAANYVAGTSQFHGTAISNPTISGSKLTWSGSFSIPPGTSRDLTYQVTIPNTEGTYINSAIARIGSTQIDSTLDTNDNVPATATVRVTPLRISGTVFEDPNYGGGAGRNFSAAGGPSAIGVMGATVELYELRSGSYVKIAEKITSSTSGSEGNYSFGSADGLIYGNTYRIRVVNNTVRSRRPNGNTTTGLWPVQTFRFDADESNSSDRPIINEVGGRNPAVQDPGTQTNNSLLPANTQSYTQIVATGSFSGVDFGFNFSTIVNTNNSGQGSLSQFITNSNALGNTNLDQIANPSPASGQTAIDPAAGDETSIFMIPTNQLTNGVAEINITSLLPSITGANANNTIIDGRTQTINIGNTNNATLGAGGTVGVDKLNLSQLNGPEVQLKGPNSLATGLDIQANNIRVQGIALYGFGTKATTNANINIGGSASNSTITGNVIGTTANSFTDVGTSRSGSYGVYTTSASGQFNNNLIGYNGRGGIEVIVAGTVSAIIENNEIRGNAIFDSRAEGTNLGGGGSGIMVRGNLFTGNGGPGIDTAGSTGSNVYVNNTVTNNGLNIPSQSDPQTSGIRIQGTNNVIDRNIIANNYGAGILVRDVGSSTWITKNSIYGNGSILSSSGAAPSGQIGIDLIANGGNGDSGGTSSFVTLNDGTTTANSGNTLLDYPVFTSTTINGTDLVLSGFSRPNATIELFIADNDPSGFGEGQTYLTTVTEGSAADSDNGTGSYSGTIAGINQGNDSNANRFKFTIPLSSLPGVSGGTRLTATATISNNTSEFSGVSSVTTPVASNPNLLLSKRITAIRSGATTTTFTTVFDSSTIPSDPNAAHPNWPTGYLKGGGVTDTPPTATPSPVDPVDSFPLRSNNEIEYTIYFLSSGNLTAQNVKFCDRIPQNLTFVPNAFNTTSPASGGSPIADRGVVVNLGGTDLAYTNVADGDIAQYFPPNSDPTAVYPNVNCGGANTNGAIVVNLGSVPHATAPGTPANSYGYIRFRAKVN
jgi:trimeric autotransporter adhesin